MSTSQEVATNTTRDEPKATGKTGSKKFKPLKELAIYRHMLPFTIGEPFFKEGNPTMRPVHPAAFELRFIQQKVTIAARNRIATSKKEELKKQRSKWKQIEGRNLPGAQLVLRKHISVSNQAIALSNEIIVQSHLSIIDAANQKRFQYFSEYQWARAMDPRPKDINTPWVYTEKEQKICDYFNRTSRTYGNKWYASVDQSKKARALMDQVPKECRDWIRENYGECWRCKCFFHKSMLNLHAKDFPMFCQLVDSHNAEVYGKYSCADCINGLSKDDWYNEDLSETPDKSWSGYVPALEPQAASTKKKKRKKKKKKRSKKTVNNDSLSITPSEEEEKNSDDGSRKSEILHRSGATSPTTVTSADSIDWVDYLQETGSILALNEYMDAVLGVDDSMVSEDYDGGVEIEIQQMKLEAQD